MAKWRVWAECIHDVYLDVEAETEEKALEIADTTDGGEFIDDPLGGQWIMGSAYRINEKGEEEYD